MSGGIQSRHERKVETATAAAIGDDIVLRIPEWRARKHLGVVHPSDYALRRLGPLVTTPQKHTGLAEVLRGQTTASTLRAVFQGIFARYAVRSQP